MDRVELNNLYLEVQSKLESLMVEYRILPGELHFYVLNNIEDLCKEFNFGDVKVLKVVLEDVASHIYNSHSDEVLTFESYVSKLKFM